MNDNSTPLSTTLEDYLEAILDISKASGIARSKEIAEYLKIKTSSVTVAMRALAEKGLITYKPYSTVQLTASGRAIAACVANRHEVLKTFFVNILQLDSAEAEECACKMEHGITPLLCDRLTHLVALVGLTPVFKKELIRLISHPHTKQNCSSDCSCS